jgi:thioredoxin-dependent peroxiredoxin
MARKLDVGIKAPAFTLPRDGGGAISLTDFAGKKLVLFFYPRAARPAAPRRRWIFLG